MDLVKVVFANPHRQRFETKLDKAATLVEFERRVIAGSNGQLNDLERRMMLRLGKRRLNQFIAQTVLTKIRRDVHAKQRGFVPGLLARLERQADDAGQRAGFERAEHHVEFAGQAPFPPAQRHHRALTHAGGEGLRMPVVGFKHQLPVSQGMAGIQTFDPHGQAVLRCSSISRTASPPRTKPMK